MIITYIKSYYSMTAVMIDICNFHIVLPTFSSFQIHSISCPKFWFHETMRIFKSYNLRKIELLCRFRLYDDESFPAKMLQDYSELDLNMILKNLCIHPDNRKRDAKVSAISQYLIQNRPWTTLERMWTFLDEMDETDAECIVRNIDDWYCIKFREILFEDWVNWTQDHLTTSVREFLDQNSVTRDQLAQHLRQAPETFGKYSEVEEMISIMTSELELSSLIITDIAQPKSYCELDSVKQPSTGIW